RVEELKINVHFQGMIANEKLPAVLNACEAFILPSLYEGNPKVLLEAMSCGLPVIGTNVEGISSLIKDGETGLLCETSSESIAQTIQKLFADPHLRNQLGNTARAQILATASLSHAIATERIFYDSKK
ncbi:glycosyltransferase family 4 protein, partial [Candidatus Uhrbacteria bacterium]|nr:glycosyltransferase family 4 protein [Candidatus Uhrbacteria bacterium]